LHVRLPPQCSSDALGALFRRMYCDEVAYEKLQLDILLPMAQCARMLCLEDLHVELVNLIGHCVQTNGDAESVMKWAESHHDSEVLAKLAKGYERTGFMMDMERELREMIVNTIKNPGDGETIKLIEKLFVKRAKKGADMVRKNIDVLKAVLVRDTIFLVTTPSKPRGQTEQTVRLSALPGTVSFLQMVCWERSARAAIELITVSLLDSLPCQSLSGQSVAGLLCLLSQNGHVNERLRLPLSNLLKRLGQEEQLKAVSGLALMKSCHLKAIVNKAFLEILIGEARVVACKRLVPVLSTLDVETRGFVVREMFGDSDEES